MGAEENPLISIIVTAFNVEKYFHACLESVVSQTYRPLKCIVIIDGSPDRCGEIANRFQCKYPEIFFVKEIRNSGVSIARNTGLAHTSGKYVAFLDGDDRLSSSYIENMMVACVQFDADIAASRVVDCYDTGENRLSYLSAQFKKDGYVKRVDMLGYVPCWGKLFKVEKIKDIQFPPGLIHEDNFYSTAATYEAKNLCFTSSALYLRTIRGSGPASITQSLDARALLQYKKCLLLVVLHLKKRNADLQFMTNVICRHLFGITHYFSVLEGKAGQSRSALVKQYLIPSFRVAPVATCFALSQFLLFKIKTECKNIFSGGVS